MKRIIIVTLSIALSGLPLSAAAAQSDWRTVAERLTPGTYVVVQLADGSEVKGTFLAISDGQLEVSLRTRVPVPPRQLSFDDIRSVEPRRPGMSAGKKFLLIAGIGWGIVGLGVLVILSVPTQ